MVGKISIFRTVRELSKSGIVALVLISVLGGYLIGHSPEAPLDLKRLIMTLIGILFLSSGSSALNQLQERKVDATMPRTARRPIPSGRLTPMQATVFVLISLIAGVAILAMLDIQLVVLGLLAVILYNGLYTLWWKRHWAYAAVPGAIPGALPILMGFVAANGQLFHPSGIYLFLILFYWQMPHFWVLALRFREDYQVGKFPTLPVAHGEGITVFQIILWCLGYIGIALIAPLFLQVRAIYLGIAFPVCAFLLWSLRIYVQHVHETGSKKWLPFFLGVNFSLILFIGAAALDLWSVNLLTSYWVGR
jgi:protoheme IX farnesyltransferase